VNAKTLGQKPTLAETLEYYDREDVRSFIYQACLKRRISMFFAAEMRWTESWRDNFLTLESPEHLPDTIVATFGDSMNGLAEDEPLRFYLSFHATADMLDDYKDFVLEADCRGWRKSFDDLYGAIEILDKFGVTYRIKFSGHRSLHFMIPWEAFPERFNGVSVRKQWNQIHKRIRAYFAMHGGLRAAHRPGGILRLAYSLNENTGLVSLPIPRDELEDFRPWEASMHHVKIDHPWFGDVPEDAKQNTERFLAEVFDDTKDGRRVLSPGIKVKPKDTTPYASGESYVGARHALPFLEKQIQYLHRKNPDERAQAAWNLMVSDYDIPMEVLASGLEDEDATVRWFLAEALQRKVGQKSALELAFKLLLDNDEYVRVSTTDFIVRAYEGDPLSSLETLMDSSGNRDDIAYIIRKVCVQNPEAAEDVLQNLIDYTIRVGEVRTLADIFPVVNSLISVQPMKKMLRYLFRIMSYNRVSRESIRILEQFWPNNVLTRSLSLKIAASLGIELPRTRPPRIQGDEAGEILALVDNALEEATTVGKINMLVTMLLHGRKPTRVIAARVIKIVDGESVRSIIAGVRSRCLNSLRLSAGTVAEVLKEIDPDPVGSLLELLKSEDSEIQQSALLLLRALGMRKAVRPLVEMLKDPSTKLRIFVVRALGGISGAEATDGLIAALDDRNRLVRMEAIQELRERMDSPGVRDAITRRQQDRSKHVRKMAREILVG
jgi:HEAT repeat protein